VKELLPGVVKEGSSLELCERLIMAASFAVNLVFTLGKRGCFGIHMIGHQLTAKYGIDHGATLAIVSKPCLESQFHERKAGLAASAVRMCPEYGRDQWTRERDRRKAVEVGIPQFNTFVFEH
jgi:alcohol dehydrogenase YqhD (iron-dependent ADH family)